MAGYSGTPLIQKIGIKAGHRIVLRNHPETFLKELGPLPEGAMQSNGGQANVVVCFTERLVDLKKAFPAMAGKLAPDGMLWISWPKKASGRPTDLTEDVVRKVGLECGLVDVKVCAIDETWSGLKFVIRLKDRPAKTPMKPLKKVEAKRTKDLKLREQ
jgi:hypothetical protein